MKIFEKKHKGNKIKIYCLGIKIFSYKMKNGSNNIFDYKSLGVKIGERTEFVTWPKPNDYPDFGSEPFLIEIGNDCLISFGVTFLTHDGSRKICLKYIDKNKRNDIISWKKIKIGNNVFIGCRSIIMPGVTIGNDVVIGAGSVVTKNIPDGQVWAGNPAKYIKTTKELAHHFEEFNETDYVKTIKKEFANELATIKKIGE